MKNNKLLILIGLLLLPVTASAQFDWTFDPTFIPDTANTDDVFSNIHGIAVDPDGKVWVQSFSATETIITSRDGNNGDPDTLSTRAIYVYNADGTPAVFSPLIVLEWADGTTPADTLGRVWTGSSYEAYSGRGITTSAGDGNIVISQFNRLYRVDYKTGQALAKADIDCGAGAITEATTDADDNVYVSCVATDDGPTRQLSSDLSTQEVIITPNSGSFSRDLQVSEDGNTLWWAGYTNGAIFRYTKPDQFSGFDAVPDTVLRGIKAEVFDIHPVTKYLWVAAGSLNDVPSAPYNPQTWYAFDYADLESATILDSLRWVPGGDNEFDGARPRAMDFSPDGKIAYIGSFSAGDTEFDVQKLTTSQVFVSKEDDLFTDTPESYLLEQNYPNPFNPTTNIKFTLKDAGFVSLKVYDLTGRLVSELASERMNAGEHTRTFNAQGLASGVYIYTLEANGVRLTNKMTLIK